MSAMHPSCIKIPGSKESVQNQNSSVRELDIRDHISTKNDLINIANETLGNEKWNHTITSQTLDFVEYITGKWHVGCASFVKVQLANGSFHEDMGYSNSEGTNKGLTIFSARTGSITNALKNTLLCFGGEIAKTIKNSNKPKTGEENPVTSGIGEPQRLVNPNLQKIFISPTAQSTPRHKSPDPSKKSEKNNGDIPAKIPSVSSEGRTSAQSSPIRIIKPMQESNGIQVDKPVSAEEEKRLERKRRQAQKQEEYKRMMKEKEASDKPNARF